MSQAIIGAQSIASQPSLSEYIRASRLGIDPHTRRLGDFVRRANRVGRLVSQEEAAEALDVTRQWYSMIEIRSGTRVSTALLSRLARAFMLTPSQRELLFKLALPEFAGSQPAPKAPEPSFSWMCSYTHRLMHATSTREILTSAAELTAELFPDVPLVCTMLRTGPGAWEHVRYIATQEVEQQHRAMWSSFADALYTNAVDEIGLHPALAFPGDVGTMALYASSTIRCELDEALATHGFSGWQMLHGRICSKRGEIASVIMLRPQRAYSEVETALLSTCATLTSLALR